MSLFVFALLKVVTMKKYPFFAFYSCFFLHPHVCVCVCVYSSVCVCSFQKSILSFRVYAGDGVQLVRFSGEHVTCAAIWPAPVLFLFVCLLFLFCFVLLELQPHYDAWAGLDLAILLPQSPKPWDYRQAALP